MTRIALPDQGDQPGRPASCSAKDPRRRFLPTVRPERTLVALAAALGVSGLAAAAPGHAAAASDADAAPAAGSCDLGGGDPVRVAAVTDDLELDLADGRRIRLSGVDPARATALRPGLARDARAALDALVRDRDVAVEPLVSTPDRWNRTAGVVAVLEADGTRVSLNEGLVEAGWARARPQAEAHRCFGRLLALEARARAERRGLWADPFYAPADPDDRGALSERRGGMVLVEGTLRLRSDRARSYLSLGRLGSPFVATLSRRAAKALSKAGLDVGDYVGTRVRLRGVLDDRFGPKIDLRDPDQFESLEPGPAGGATHVDTDRPRR